MHTLHGRSLAVGDGREAGNHELKVICTGGDGDGFGIGGNHFTHTMRRNVDLTYIVMDNQIYGLTTGQTSPTSRKGMKTKSTPFGNVENPINPIPLAIVGGATYVARGFSGKQRHLVDLFKGAIQHKGFSLRGCFQPLRHLQQGQHLPVLQPARETAGGSRATTRRISARRWRRVTSGARKFPSACSGNARICRRWRNWSRCYGRRAAGLPQAGHQRRAGQGPHLRAALSFVLTAVKARTKRQLERFKKLCSRMNSSVWGARPSRLQVLASRQNHFFKSAATLLLEML